MAVRPQAHNEEWHVVTTTGVVLETFRNGRDAHEAARSVPKRFLTVKAVRA